MTNKPEQNSAEELRQLRYQNAQNTKAIKSLTKAGINLNKVRETYEIDTNKDALLPNPSRMSDPIGLLIFKEQRVILPTIPISPKPTRSFSQPIAVTLR